MCRLRNFCYCCRLRTGAIFAAMFTFTYAAGLIVGGALILDRVSFWVESDAKLFQQVSASCQLASGILSLIVFVLLVIAICKHRPGMVLPWLIVAILNILLQVAIVATSIIVKPREWINLWILAFTSWFIYMWIVVFSYYKLLEERYFPATSSPKSSRWENGRV